MIRRGDTGRGVGGMMLFFFLLVFCFLICVPVRQVMIFLCYFV